MQQRKERKIMFFLEENVFLFFVRVVRDVTNAVSQNTLFNVHKVIFFIKFQLLKMTLKKLYLFILIHRVFVFVLLCCEDE